MIGEVAKGTSLPVALRRFHDASNGRLEIMALLYDLDGALEAGQAGLARFTAISLIEASVALWLRERGITVPSFASISLTSARARVALSLLAGVNDDLAQQVSALYRAALPPGMAAVRAFCQVAIALVGELTGYADVSPDSVVSGWADLAQAVRALCDRMGVPLNDFYWAPPGAQTWYGDALEFAAGQESLGEADRR